MGCKNKFERGQIVWSDPDGSYGTIVDYMQDARGRGRYRFQRVLGTYPVGPAVWRDSFDLDVLDGTWYDESHDNFQNFPTESLVAIHRKNMAIPDRGCRCNCCIHVKQERGNVRSDGTFRSDDG